MNKPALLIGGSANGQIRYEPPTTNRITVFSYSRVGRNFFLHSVPDGFVDEPIWLSPEHYEPFNIDDEFGNPMEFEWQLYALVGMSMQEIMQQLITAFVILGELRTHSAFEYDRIRLQYETRSELRALTHKTT